MAALKIMPPFFSRLAVQSNEIFRPLRGEVKRWKGEIGLIVAFFPSFFVDDHLLLPPHALFFFFARYISLRGVKPSSARNCRR